MAEVNANIGVHIDTSQALAQLKNLQREISLFHTSIAKSSATAAAAQRNLQTDFLNAINATGKFAAEFRTIKTASESFTTSLEKNKFSMREYFRYAGAATKTFGSLFKTEFDTINKVAEDRVKRLQTQYIKMGRDASGALKAISVTPLALDMNNLHTQTMIAAQRQQLFNELISKGTTNLINFGKNTQWAGRQLMVGFSVPLSIFGSQATKIFMDIEQQALRFKRVYGDLFTSQSETNANLTAIRSLAAEYTKYGVAVKDTMSLAADAAAAGFQGAKLQETVRQATKLSVLGEVDKQQAFQATISLQTAFQMSNEELAQSVDFLNAVENQSVTSLQDMTDAIPKVAPVIRGLGGDVKDMAVFLTAMKEGGVDAASAANGLKSALASMINPTKAAKEMLAGVGINIQDIATRNKGNIMRTVIELGDALKGLEPMARTQVLEKLFGKYQFARVSALFDNISKSGSQAQRTMELMSMSASDLARISNKELTSIEENSAVKFKAAVESLKTSLAPVGETFLKIITPIIEFIGKVADKFSGLSDHTKKVIAVIVTVIGGIAPVVLMLVGLFANFFGQMMKFFAMLRNGYLGLTGQSKVLGEQLQYQTTEMQDAAAVAHSLDQIHAKLTQRFTIEADAVAALTRTYLAAASAAERFGMANPGMMIPGRGGKTKKYADGVVMVPGTGNEDTVPAMLTPGEAIIPAKMTKRYATLINAMVAGNIPGYNGGNSGKKSITGGQSLLLSGMGFMGSGNNASGFGMDRGFFSQGQGFIQSMIASLSGGSHTLGRDTGTESRRMTENVMAEYTSEMKPYAEEIVNILRNTAKNMGGVENSSLTLAQVVEKSKDDLKPIFERMRKSGSKAALAADAIEKHGLYPTVSEMGGTYGETRAPSAREGDTAGSVSWRRISGGKSRFQPAVKRMWSFLTKGTDLEQLPVTYAHANEARLLGPELPFTGGAMKPGAVDTEEKNRLIALMQQKGEIAKGSYSSTEIKSAVRLKKQGKADATTYQKEVDANTEDIYLASRDRQSPHRQAGKDGADDAKAYSDAKEKVIKKRRVASSRGGTVGPNGVIGGTDIGAIAAQEQGFIGPMPGTFAQRMRSRMSGGMSGLRGKMAAMGPMGAARGMLGVSGAVMTASMMPGPVGDFAQKLMPATMGLQALATALPLLTNPIGATVAAFAGLAFLLHKANQAYEKHIQAIKDSAKAEVARKYGSSNASSDYAKFTGQNLASTQQFNRAGNARFISADLAKQQTFADFYSQKGNEATKAIQGAKGASKVGAIAADIANRAAQFGLSPQDIAANIKAASALVGANEFEVKAKLQQMLAPGGKDILKEPLTIKARMDFLVNTSNTQLQDLQKRIGDIKQPTAPAAVATGGRGGYNYGAYAQIEKQKEKGIRDTTIASELLKKSFFDQTQALALLNQQFASGTITQKEYDAAFTTLRGNMDQVVGSTNDLIDKMNTLDRSGKTSKALLSDMADTVLKSFKDLGKETTKIVKESLSKMPAKVETDILVGLAAGSLQPTDIIVMQDIFDKMQGKTYEEKIKILDSSKNGLMEGTIAQIEKAILTTRKLEIETQKAKALHDNASSATIQGFNTQLAEIDQKIAAADSKIKGLEKVDPTKKVDAGGGKTLDTNAGAAKAESTILDTIIKQYRDVNSANTKLTEGWKASAAALKNLFGKKNFESSFGSGGLASAIRGKGGSESLINLVLGMSPQEWKDHSKELFNFDKNGKIKSLKTLASGIGEVFGKIFAGNVIEKNRQFVTGLANQQKVISQLTSTGMSYSDALQFVQDNGQDAVNALSALDPASKAWKEMKKSIDDTNAALLNTPEGALAAVNKIADAGIAYIQAKTTAATAAAQGALDADQKAVDAVQAALEKAQRSIEPMQKIIDANSHSIETLQHQMDVDFERPIAALGERSNKLNNDLSIMDHQAQKINEEFDKQQEALQKVSKINQQIIAQNKQQISLADAITSGDMSAVAQNIQDMRAQNAANASGSQQESLDAARKNAIDNLTVGGKTRKQIEEELYQIGQQQFDLEQKKKELQDKIQALQDANYAKQQEIYVIEQNTIIPLQQQLRDKQDQLKADQDKLKATIDTYTYNGMTLTQLEDMKAKAALSYAEYKKVADAAGTTAANAKAAAGQIASYAKTLTDIPSVKTVDIYQTIHISTVYDDAGSGSGSGSGSKKGNAFGGFIRKASGGLIGGNGILDTVPTMLTPGEFVVNRRAAKAFAPLLQSINSQAYPDMQGRIGSSSNVGSIGGGNYSSATSNNMNNYNLSVNLHGGNMDANQVANTVIRKIKLMENNNIRRSTI